jgi:hypothetical protein
MQDYRLFQCEYSLNKCEALSASVGFYGGLNVAIAVHLLLSAGRPRRPSSAKKQVVMTHIKLKEYLRINLAYKEFYEQ